MVSTSVLYLRPNLPETLLSSPESEPLKGGIFGIIIGPVGLS